MISKAEGLLARVLEGKGLLSSELAQNLADEAAKSKGNFYSLLLQRGVLSEEILLKNLSELLKVPFVNLNEFSPEKTAIEKVPLKIAEYYKIVPLKVVKRKMTIAVSLPLDLKIQDDIQAHVGCEIEVVFAREKDILETLKRFYGFGAQMIGEMMAQSALEATPAAAASRAAAEDIESIEKVAGDASIAKLVNQIILEAYKKRASDIHIEPYRGSVRLRYRIDGTLNDAHVQTEMNRFILPILSRIKIMSNLNIVERRLPQDGRAIVKVEDATLDLRVSSMPTPHGESVVIRMLPVNRIFDLTKLGLSSRELKAFENLIQKPHGIIFITGPTGSGKSTTLYACLNRLNGDERKIITIEDPVEYEMEGATQIQVNPSIGLDFAKGLRSILRHDPDVIMVGEVRDLETAEIAIRVSLTGHLVFSTLHTNDAASGATRLIDIGVEPYLVASSVDAFVAQRLVRVLCAHCKQEDKGQVLEVKKQIAREMELKSLDFPIFRGKGCAHCNSTGFMGRVAIYEILLVSEKIRGLIMKKAAASEIKRQALWDGMRTLRQDGWQKVLDGVTTPEEILEVTAVDKEPETQAAPAREAAGILNAEPKRPGGDRRGFKRVDHTLKVHYKVVKLPAAVAEGYSDTATGDVENFSITTDVGAGGLIFISKESIPTGSILELKLEIPDGHSPLTCLGRIIREEEAENGKAYKLAVCYLDLSASNRSRIDKFVESEIEIRS